MKSLELNLNKRLLIVEMTGELETTDLYGWNLQPVKKICEGPELTQSLVDPFLDKKTDDYGIYWYRDYTVVDESIHDPYTFLNPKESLISAIESNGWYWKINPMLKAEGYSYVDLRCPIKYEHKYNQAESRTFNPEKCLIFEIL